jgi:dTDP-glucose pyrophosphorylase
LGAKPLAAVSENAKGELEISAAIDAAIRDDKLAIDVLKDTIRRLEAHDIDRDLAALKIQEEAVRRYDQANRRLASVKLAENSHQRGRQEALIRYTALRREGYDLLAQAVRTNDDALASRGLKRIEESNVMAKP